MPVCGGGPTAVAELSRLIEGMLSLSAEVFTLKQPVSASSAYAGDEVVVLVLLCVLQRHGVILPPVEAYQVAVVQPGQRQAY